MNKTILCNYLFVFLLFYVNMHYIHTTIAQPLTFPLNNSLGAAEIAKQMFATELHLVSLVFIKVRDRSNKFNLQGFQQSQDKTNG